MPFYPASMSAEDWDTLFDFMNERYIDLVAHFTDSETKTYEEAIDLGKWAKAAYKIDCLDPLEASELDMIRLNLTDYLKRLDDFDDAGYIARMREVHDLLVEGNDIVR